MSTTTTYAIGSKEEAAQSFINYISRMDNPMDMVIVCTGLGDYWCCNRSKVYDDDIIVYTYPMFVNSDANLDVSDIVKRFEGVQ